MNDVIDKIVVAKMMSWLMLAMSIGALIFSLTTEKDMLNAMFAYLILSAIFDIKGDVLRLGKRSSRCL